MTSLRIPIYTALFILITVAGTLIHGRYSNRWGSSESQLEAATEALTLAPAAFGDWEMESEEEFSDRVKGILKCTGSWSRVYRHRSSGQLATAAMMVGPPGPSVKHKPEICYSSAGFKVVETEIPVHIELPNGAQHLFLETTFVSADVSGRSLATCHSFRERDLWLVPSNPRIAFGGSPLVYKLQVAAYTTDAKGPEEDVCQAFLKDLVVALEQTVFGKHDP